VFATVQGISFNRLLRKRRQEVDETMDIKLDKIQMDMAREVRRFLDKECPTDYVREMFEDDRGFTEEKWRKMVGMDWLGVRIPEKYGGMGMGQLELNVLLEEMGRVLLPGPFLSTAVLAAEAVMAAGSDLQKTSILPRIAAGETKGTLALHEWDGGSDPEYIGAEAHPNGGGFILSGTKIGVLDAHVSELMICAALTEPGSRPLHGITLFLVNPKDNGVSVSLLPVMDGTRKMCAVEFKDVPLSREDILGEVNTGWSFLEKVLQRVQVGLCAENVGGAQRAMEIATSHAKSRVQFDKPIGSFQAVKHRCAEMYVEVESGRSLSYWAAWAQDEADQTEASLAASVAKAYCAEMFRKVSTSAIQVLGATGYSWEHDIHLYLKRAKVNEVLFGDPDYHREKIVRTLTRGQTYRNE
jgi:alkylation response protein AidB-like acyl-CoA dehydrogenase